MQILVKKNESETFTLARPKRPGLKLGNIHHVYVTIDGLCKGAASDEPFAMSSESLLREKTRQFKIVQDSSR